MKKYGLLVFVLLALFLLHSGVAAGSKIGNYPSGKFGIGFQRITWNCWGLSGMIEITPDIAVEGLIGLIGDRKAYGFRALYRAIKIKDINIYGYGLIGTEKVGEWGKKDEMGLLIGGGAGIEYNLERIIADTFSIGFHVEIGVENLSGYVLINADYTSLIYSAGFHIRI